VSDVGKRNKRSLNEKADTFAREVVLKKSTQADAYRFVYPSSLKWNPKTVYSKASTFSKTERVKKRIRHYQKRINKKIAEKFDLEIEDILERLYAIAFNDPAEMYEPSGMIKNIHDIPPHIRKTLTGVKHKVVMHNSINEDGIEISGPTVVIEEFRQENRKPALEQLLEYKLNVLRDPLPTPEDDEDIEVDKKQLARELLLLVYEANRFRRKRI